MWPCWIARGERFRGPKDTSALLSFVHPVKNAFDTAYRYFGRAKDLPGVKELFEKKGKQQHYSPSRICAERESAFAAEVDEETHAHAHYKKYQNQGASYYGDLDEGEESLLKYEMEAEEQGDFLSI